RARRRRLAARAADAGHPGRAPAGRSAVGQPRDARARPGRQQALHLHAAAVGRREGGLMRAFRSRLLSTALALAWLALPAASLAHEGHDHATSVKAAPAGDANATSQPHDDAAPDPDSSAARDAKRRKMADEDAAKPKAAPAPPSDAPPGSGPH